ncbi:MAG: DUF3842 family protein [Eubacteriales bacterium]|nr:DUF3842 family protein [Eubacteriales bacterium]
MILIVDGQGGRIGCMLIEQLLSLGAAPEELVAVGSNSIATAAMLKAGAKKGATGENPVVYNAARAAVIAGPIGILSANAMLGEITPAMAAAIGESAARKVLVPVSNCSVEVAGVVPKPLGEYVKEAAEGILRGCGEA